ncbi:MAG: hypothetical protein M0Q40_02060 [Limnochordia bacterium]|nr:hypothetical protein [Limnochordia bacterium]
MVNEGRFTTRLFSSLLGWLLLLPACVAIGFFSWMPLVGLVRMSMSAIDLAGARSTYVGLAHFQTLFADGTFNHSLKITVFVVLGKLVFTGLGLWLGHSSASYRNQSNLYKLSLSLVTLLGSAGLFYGIFQGSYIFLLSRNINLGIFGPGPLALLKGIVLDGLFILPLAILLGYVITSLTENNTFKYASQPSAFALSIIFFLAFGLVTSHLVLDQTIAAFINTNLQGGVTAQELAAAAGVVLAIPLLILGIVVWWIMEQQQPLLAPSSTLHRKNSTQPTWAVYIPLIVVVLLLVPTLALLIAQQFSEGPSSLGLPFRRWTTNGLLVGGVVAGLQLLLGAMAGYSLNVIKPVGSRVASLFLTAPLFLFPLVLTPFLRIVLFNIGLFDNLWAIALTLGASPLSIFIFRLFFAHRQPSNLGPACLVVILTSFAQSFAQYQFIQSVILTEDKLTLIAGLNNLDLFFEYGPTIALRAYGWSLLYSLPRMLLVFLLLVFVLPRLSLSTRSQTT